MVVCVHHRPTTGPPQAHHRPTSGPQKLTNCIRQALMYWSKGYKVVFKTIYGVLFLYHLYSIFLYFSIYIFLYLISILISIEIYNIFSFRVGNTGALSVTSVKKIPNRSLQPSSTKESSLSPTSNNADTPNLSRDIYNISSSYKYLLIVVLSNTWPFFSQTIEWCSSYRNESLIKKPNEFVLLPSDSMRTMRAMRTMTTMRTMRAMRTVRTVRI